MTVNRTVHRLSTVQRTELGSRWSVRRRPKGSSG